MSKRAFRPTPRTSTPNYPILPRHLGRRASALAGLGLSLGLLAAGCEPEHMMGVPVPPAARIDARPDTAGEAGPEAGPRPDAGVTVEQGSQPETDGGAHHPQR